MIINSDKKKEESRYLSIVRSILFVLLNVVAVVLFTIVLAGIYFLGLIRGYQQATVDAEAKLASYAQDLAKITPTKTMSPTPIPLPTRTRIVSPSVTWGGPELWKAVNERRIELGVNPLQQRDELCTIASIRLNELLELGKLDAHEGFGTLRESRPDLEWIFEKYAAIAEFLAVGGETPEETVDLWQNTLGHKKLLEGGEYVWGCVYAQDSFSVAITAY